MLRIHSVDVLFASERPIIVCWNTSSVAVFQCFQIVLAADSRTRRALLHLFLINLSTTRGKSHTSLTHFAQSSKTRVSSAADRPARHRGLAHGKYSVYLSNNIIIIKLFLLLCLSAGYRSRRWVWSTVIRRPSKVYDTHRRTKLTAPETISRSRDTVRAHQNLNGSRDLISKHVAPFKDSLPSVG